MKKEWNEKEIEICFLEIQQNIKLPSSIENRLDYQKLSKKKKTSTVNLAAVVACILMLVVPVGYAAFPNIFKAFTGDQGLMVAEKNHNVSYLEKSTEDKGIKLTVKGVVSDGLRTVVNIRVEGKLSGEGIPQLSGIHLIDKKNKKYRVYHWGQGEVNKNDLFDETNIEFEGSPKSSTTLRLDIDQINGVNGKWVIEFPVKPIAIKEITIDAVGIWQDRKYHFTKIRSAATQLVLEGTYEGQTHDSGISYVLSNGKEKVEEFSANWALYTKVKNSKVGYQGSIEFPPIEINDVMTLSIEDFSSKKVLFSMPINIE